MTFEMNLDLKIVARSGYTFLDLLSDVGGIESILITGTSFFLVIVNHNYLDSYMVSRLYKHNTAPS